MIYRRINKNIYLQTLKNWFQPKKDNGTIPNRSNAIFRREFSFRLNCGVDFGISNIVFCYCFFESLNSKWISIAIASIHHRITTSHADRSSDQVAPSLTPKTRHISFRSSKMFISAYAMCALVLTRSLSLSRFLPLPFVSHTPGIKRFVACMCVCLFSIDTPKHPNKKANPI